MHNFNSSNPQDCDNQQTTQAVAEQQARKSTLSMTTAIINRCTNIFSLAREKVDDINVTDILRSSCIVTTLLPLVLAHIGPLATSELPVVVNISCADYYVSFLILLILMVFDCRRSEKRRSSNQSSSGNIATCIRS